MAVGFAETGIQCATVRRIGKGAIFIAQPPIARLALHRLLQLRLGLRSGGGQVIQQEQQRAHLGGGCGEGRVLALTPAGVGAGQYLLPRA